MRGRDSCRFFAEVEKGAHDWGACALMLHKGFVKVGEHPVAELDTLTNAGECFFTELPRFLLFGIFRTMDSEKWEKTRGFYPAHHECFCHVVTKTTHIRPYKRNSTHGKPESHGNACLEVTPMAEIIAEPEGRILADPRASASGKQKGSHIGAAFEKPIPCRFCHPCRVLVMVSFMSCFPLIEKHFLLCHGTRRGVVHIEPETRKSFFRKGADLIFPPIFSFVCTEIGEQRRSWPYKTTIKIAIGILAEGLLFYPALSHGIAFFIADTRIQNGNHMSPFFEELRHRSLWIFERFRIRCENFVAIHRVNVEPETIAGNSRFCHLKVQTLQVFRARISPAALMITQAPERRPGCCAHEPSVASQNARHILTSDKENFSGAASRTPIESGSLYLFLTRVQTHLRIQRKENGARIVNQNAESFRTAFQKEKRNVRVKRIGVSVAARRNAV